MYMNEIIDILTMEHISLSTEHKIRNRFLFESGYHVEHLPTLVNVQSE